MPEGLEDPQLDSLNEHPGSLQRRIVTPADDPGPVSCAVIHFKFSLLNSEIMYTLHNISPNAPKHTYLRIPDVKVWQSGLYDRLLEIRRTLPVFSMQKKHLSALCEIRYHEIVMLLFRPTPRIRAPGKDSLIHCFQSAQATIDLWKELYDSDRMSYSWTSIHSICLSAIIMLYCIWMVGDLTISTEIDSLTRTMASASNLLSAAGEHWADARRCRDSLNNLTSATIRWLVNLRLSQGYGAKTGEETRGGGLGRDARHDSSAVGSSSQGQTSHRYQRQSASQVEAGTEEHERLLEFPWVDTYINGEDLASLFRATNPYSADLSHTMEGMFSDYQPLFDFYQGNDFNI